MHNSDKKIEYTHTHTHINNKPITAEVQMKAPQKKYSIVQHKFPQKKNLPIVQFSQ